MSGFFALTLESKIRGQDKTGVVGLTRLPAKIHDMRPVWPKVEGAIRLAFLEAFNQEGNASGRWLPLSVRYKAWKDRHYPGKKILELTGRLRGSLVSGLHSDAVTIATQSTLFIGSNVPYAKYHQQGTEIMVARPPIALTSRQKFQVGQAIHRAMKNHFNQKSA